MKPITNLSGDEDKMCKFPLKRDYTLGIRILMKLWFKFINWRWWVFKLYPLRYYWKVKTWYIRLNSKLNCSSAIDFAMIVLPPLNPNSPPLGAAYIHSAVKRAGYKSRLIDFSVGLSKQYSSPKADKLGGTYFDQLGTFEYWLRVLEETKSHILGFTVWMCNQSTTTKFSAFVKACHPEWVLIFGGPACTRENVYTLTEYADYCVFNEGEDVIVKVIQCLLEKKTLVEIPNVYFRINGSLSPTIITEGLSDIDNLPYPDFTSVNLSAYRSFEDGSLRIPIQFSRGCIGNCSFCNHKHYHETQRTRHGIDVYNEVLCQMELYKTRKFYFVDDSLISYKTKDEIVKFCDLVLENRLNMDWEVNATRVDHILCNSAFVSRLALAGLKSITLGVESFSDRVLRHMRKASTGSLAIDVMQTLNDHGIGVNIYIIYGYPIETAKDFEITLDCLKKISHCLRYVVCNAFFPTQSYLDHCREVGAVAMNSRYEPAWTSDVSDLESREQQFFQLIETLQSIKENFFDQFHFIAGDPHYLTYLESWDLDQRRSIEQSWKNTMLSSGGK